MIEPIDPGIRLAQLLDEDITAVKETEVVSAPSPQNELFVSNSPFVDILGKAIDALEGVSKQESYANQLIDKYVNGEADLQKVMTETAKANLLVNLTVTVVNNAVTTFKEITQMQV